MFKVWKSASIVVVVALVLSLGLVMAPPTAGVVEAYDRDAAVTYADCWTVDDPNSTLNNSDYPYYPGNDCANYVSQCLIAGGHDLSAGTDGHGTGVTSGCIPNCDNLHKHLVNYQHVEYSKGSTSDPLPENLQAGDVIIFGDSDDEWKHAAIVVGGSGNNVTLDAHTNHRKHRPFSFFASSFTIVHTYHFPTVAETGYSQKYFGTGAFYGERALQVVIYEPGHDYEGYILNNTDSTEQDMIVGENTTSYSGCSYYVEGYCTNTHKGIPSEDREFEQPWTSDSPNHWAYWLRKAIKFANQKGYSEDDTLSAVWYISDRSGSYNEILSSIGYPVDGPIKNPGSVGVVAPPGSAGAAAPSGLYIPPLLPTTKKKVVEPASFMASYLRITPPQVSPNQEVEVSINVANTGEESGSRAVALYINGKAEQSRTVTVAPGSSQNVVFTVTRATPGTYNVLVEGQNGQFAVRSTSVFGGGGLGTGGIIAIIVVLIALIVGLILVMRGAPGRA